MCKNFTLIFTCRDNGCRTQQGGSVDLQCFRKCQDYPNNTNSCLIAKLTTRPETVHIPLKCWPHTREDIAAPRREWESELNTFVHEKYGKVKKIDEVDSETRRYVLEYGDSRLACLYHHWLTVVRYYMLGGPLEKQDLLFPKVSLTSEFRKNMAAAVELWRRSDTHAGTVTEIPEGSFQQLQSPGFKKFFCHWRTDGPDKNQRYPHWTVDFPGYAGDPDVRPGVGGKMWSKDHFKSFEFPGGPSYPLGGAVHRYFAHIQRRYSDYQFCYGIVQPASWWEEEEWRKRQRRGDSGL